MLPAVLTETSALEAEESSKHVSVQAEGHAISTQHKELNFLSSEDLRRASGHNKTRFTGPRSFWYPQAQFGPSALASVLLPLWMQPASLKLRSSSQARNP